MGILSIRHLFEHMRSHAQSLNPPPRAGSLYGRLHTAGCEFSPGTVLRRAALRLKRQRSLVAYGAEQRSTITMLDQQAPACR